MEHLELIIRNIHSTAAFLNLFLPCTGCNSMSKIKLKETIKDIKVFDRATDISTHMKNDVIKSKETAEQTQERKPKHSYPSKFVADNVMDGV